MIYTRLPAGGTYYPICMFPTNSERLIGISDAFPAFVYGYPSSCPRAHCTPNKSVPTLRYTRKHGPIYTGHACRHLPSAVPWISEDRLLESICSFFRAHASGSFAELLTMKDTSLCDNRAVEFCDEVAAAKPCCSRSWPLLAEALP